MRILSSQRLWQLRMKAEGRCQICGEKAAVDCKGNIGARCPGHVEMNRRRAFLSYRKKVGIAIDAPLRPGRKPSYEIAQ
jgi:hypothetical protein